MQVASSTDVPPGQQPGQGDQLGSRPLLSPAMDDSYRTSFEPEPEQPVSLNNVISTLSHSVMERSPKVKPGFRLVSKT